MMKEIKTPEELIKALAKLFNQPSIIKRIKEFPDIEEIKKEPFNGEEYIQYNGAHSMRGTIHTVVYFSELKTACSTLIPLSIYWIKTIHVTKNKDKTNTLHGIIVIKYEVGDYTRCSDPQKIYNLMKAIKEVEI